MNNIDKSFFINSRQLPEAHNIDKNIDKSIFENLKHPIIPPVGIAKPELVEKSLELIDNPDELRNYIDDLESYSRETPTESMKRQVLAHAARGFEGLGGFYGDMQQFFSSLIGISPQEKESLGREQLTEFRLPSIESLEGPDFSRKLPTSKELRKQAKESFGYYLEPKTEFQKSSQEIAEDVGAMFAVPGNLGFFQKILSPIVGQTAKQTVKSLGGSEKQQDLAKLSGMMLTSLLNLGDAKGVAETALNEAENMIAKGISYDATPTINAFRRIKNSDWYKSGPTPAKKPAFSEIERIEKQIVNSKIDGRMAMQLRRDINAIRRNLRGFDVVTPEDKKQALKYLNKVDGALLGSMEQYGKKINPNWWKNYNLSNEAFRVTQRSRALSEFIHQHGGNKVISETAKYLFPATITAGIKAIPTIAIPVTIGAAGGKTIQIVNRMVRSPILRNHYLNVIKTASLGNAKATTEAIKKFDIASQKLESQSSNKSPRKKSPTA